jgi:hypothetical protein
MVSKKLDRTAAARYLLLKRNQRLHNLGHLTKLINMMLLFFCQNREILVEEKNENSPEIRIKGRLRNSYFQKNISFIGVKCSIVKLLDRFFAQKK